MDTSRIDLLELIGRDVTLKKHASTRGGEWWGACPFCGGQEKRDPNRFHVWPAEGRYWCRRCERNGDAIQYERERHNLTYLEALDRLGLAGNGNGQDLGPRAAPVIHPKHDPANPPSPGWQAQAMAFCQEAQGALWTPDGARALAWLRDVRGLTVETIRGAGLGYNPKDRHEDRSAWNLPPKDDDKGRPKRVWLPRGVVIPWSIAGDLWRVNIRRPAGDPKYIGPAGWCDALYRADTLTPGAPAMLVEGELDALTVCQHAGDIVAAVATGSTAGARRLQWLAMLARCSRVLIAFDGDEPGEKAAAYWLDVLKDNAARWRAFYGKDANGQATADGDLRAWVLAGLVAAPAAPAGPVAALPVIQAKTDAAPDLAAVEAALRARIFEAEDRIARGETLLQTETDPARAARYRARLAELTDQVNACYDQIGALPIDWPFPGGDA